MTDELLPHFNRELAWFRRTAAEFAQAHPKIAARLRMSAEVIEDPHVSRMIEAFALLNARTRRKIEDDFPEIPQAMLQVLYPHYLMPYPSTAIVRFALAKDQADLVGGFTIPRGSMLESEPVEGDACRFSTCYPVTVWPFELKNAGYHGFPVAVPPNPWSARSRAVIRLEMTGYVGQKISLSEFSFERLRFYLNAPSQLVHSLYETVFNNSLGVAITNGRNDGPPLILDRGCLGPVGFESDEILFDVNPRSFPGYQLLSDFFVFPEKFLFFDLFGLDRGALRKLQAQHTFTIFIFLDRHQEDLERFVATETFQTGCCPVINLYRQRAEPIRLTHNQTEYRVVPDARRPLMHEVHSIDRVTALSPQNEQLEFAPFYSLKHERTSANEGRFWHATRRAGETVDGLADQGTDVFLSLVDLQFDPNTASEWTLDVTATCLNRDLPARLPFGGGQPYLQLSEGGPLQKISCLTAPTRTLRPAWGYGLLWRLISHLSLNHLSLYSPDGDPNALREILRLYDVKDSDETRGMIQGLLSVRARRITGRPGGSVSGGFARGLEVTLEFDEKKFTGNSVYLMAAVLERFLGMYSSINSFTQTIVRTARREERLCQWPPRAGEMVLS